MSLTSEMADDHRPTPYPVPNVPPELSDRIIDYLHDDEHALSACGLTCRSWLPRVRFNRFRDLRLDVTTCHAFLRLLSRTPDIGAFVRNLAITCHMRYSRRFPRCVTWDRKTLTALVSRLSNVEEIELDSLQVDEEFIGLLQGHLVTVKRLFLTRTYLDGMEALYALVSAFPQLEALYFSDALAHPSTRPPTPLALSGETKQATLVTLRVQRRTVCDTITPMFINWMMSVGLHRNLATLEIPDIHFYDTPLVDDLLRELGPTLQHLYIGFADPLDTYGTFLGFPSRSIRILI